MNNLYRLDQATYESLEKQLPRPIVTKDTSEQQIGYLLGIQHVLHILREGFTIGSGEAGRAPLRTSKR